MSITDGSVVVFDYTLSIDGKPLETSMEGEAHELGLAHSHGNMRPLTVVIGQRQIITGLEEELVAKGAEGVSFDTVIPAEKAYGARDMKMVQTVPMAQFKRISKEAPRPGMVLNMEGQRAIVTRVAGGRVVLDMNHDLAGKDLGYSVHVREVVQEEDRKVQAVLESFFSGVVPMASITDDVVSVEVPDQAKFDQQWPMHKFRLIAMLRGVTGLDKDIRLSETYPAKPATADEEE